MHQVSVMVPAVALVVIEVAERSVTAILRAGFPAGSACVAVGSGETVGDPAARVARADAVEIVGFVATA